MDAGDPQIKHMVNRFLGWKLPENFRPDGGVQFDADAAKKLDPRNLRYEPYGTNLLNATQADAMVRHMLGGRTGGFGIGEAIRNLWDGRRVRRAGWNGKQMWLALQVPDEHSKMTLPYIYIEYPAGHPAYPDGSRVPWLASQTDILANDWELLEERLHAEA